MLKFELDGKKYQISAKGELIGPKRYLPLLQSLWERYAHSSPDRGARDYQFFTDIIKPLEGKLIEFEYTDKPQEDKDIVY